MAAQQKINYPKAKTVDTVDDYFGTKVADPYRWLEDDNSTETAQWVKAENEITQAYLKKIPFRDKVKARLTELANYPKMGTPFYVKDKIYYFKNDGLQNQSVLYVKDRLDGEERMVFDPNTLSQDGTVALQSLNFSRDGRYAAYTITRNGSDWNEIIVHDLVAGKMLDDHIVWAKFTDAQWLGDGFFYVQDVDTYGGIKCVKADAEVEIGEIYYIRGRIYTDEAGERYITPDLKDVESRILGAKDRAVAMEYSIFDRVRTTVAENLERIQNTARAIATLDVLTSFANVAVNNRYVRPEVTQSGVISIKDSRHPVVEALLKEAPFVPNDVNLDNKGDRVAIITGPNMAGKSTYMRQVALIVLLAQMGGIMRLKGGSGRV